MLKKKNEVSSKMGDLSQKIPTGYISLTNRLEAHFAKQLMSC